MNDCADPPAITPQQLGDLLKSIDVGWGDKLRNANWLLMGWPNEQEKNPCFSMGLLGDDIVRPQLVSGTFDILWNWVYGQSPTEPLRQELSVQHEKSTRAGYRFLVPPNGGVPVGIAGRPWPSPTSRGLQEIAAVVLKLGTSRYEQERDETQGVLSCGG